MKEGNFSDLETKLGVVFDDKALLRQALTHRSYLNEHPHENLQHNERLEFLGDAVLELVSTEFLYERYPEKPEGELTAYRAALVNTTSLARAAQDLSLGEYVLLSRGEARDTGKARQFILANTVEAIIGAVYLDRGYAAVKRLISDVMLKRIDEIVSKGLWQDAKSRFQERAQEEVAITPAYRILEEVGPDHSKQFRAGAYLDEDLVASGEGYSKQEAEQNAARKALEQKGWN